MNWRKWTGIFIIAIIFSIAVYDVLAISGGGIESSISHMIIEWSYKYPVFTFAIGFAMGHLFWRMRDTKITGQISEATRQNPPSPSA